MNRQISKEDEGIIEELAFYYGAMGYALYTKEALEEYSEEELYNLYELAFPCNER